jgi:hypothetical protein
MLNQIKNSHKFQYWFAFFQAFPILMIVFNLSFFVFFRLYFSFNKFSKIKISNGFQILAILFVLGSMLSAVNAVDVKRSLVVLPNFLYWAIMIIFFQNYRSYLNFEIIRKGIFNGLIILNLYYWIVEKTLKFSTPFNKFILENGYAILMICFVPTALKYVLVKYGKNRAYLFASGAIILGFLSGSRAGAILILGGALLTLFSEKLSFKVIIQLVLYGVLFYFFIFKTDFFNKFLYQINPDVHSVVFKSQEVFEEEQSMLLRRLMVEKAIILFEQKPLTGIGLNNWTEYEVDFLGDFVGSEFIINKNRLEKFSAHNSYAALLGEGGLFVFVPFILILYTTIFALSFQFGKLDQYQQPILWSLIMMAIHIYFISGMSNSFTWYLLALGISSLNREP